MQKRKFYDLLIRWKSLHSHECLLVKGARQIALIFGIDRRRLEMCTVY